MEQKNSDVMYVLLDETLLLWNDDLLLDNSRLVRNEEFPGYDRPRTHVQIPMKIVNWSIGLDPL